MTKTENKAWLQGFAAVLASTWNYTHDAQIIEQAVRDHSVKLKELRAAVDPYDYRRIIEALRERKSDAGR